MLSSIARGLVVLGALALVACGDDGAGASGGGGDDPGTGGTGAGPTGGAPQGGAGGTGGAQGGGGAGGVGGTGGAQGGGGSGGATMAGPECAEDADCVISNDCCECAGRPMGQRAPECPIDCLIDTCTSLGLAEAKPTCVAGRCVVDASCNDATVTCDAPVPDCAPGSSPIVSNACYTGQCLTTIECEDVTSCGVCEGADVTCVVNSAFTPSYHCVDTQGCSPADCECLGTSVCVGAFDACSEVMGHIECQCPACVSP
jgi:hypothetical protein